MPSTGAHNISRLLKLAHTTIRFFVVNYFGTGSTLPTIIHFIDVGQGNMVLIQASDGSSFVFDCNITADNEKPVLNYVTKQIGNGTSLRAFICSHRDADHIRGVKKLHARFPIQSIWDSDHVGTTTTTPEYLNYMDLRRKVGCKVIKKQTYFDCGRTRLRMLSARDTRLEKNANAQGIVIKVEQRDASMSVTKGSAMLPADSDAETWRYAILKDYGKGDVSSDILMAGHHGSNSFFDDPNDRYYYTGHVQAINPAMTVVSVGPNVHGHPKPEAMKFYEKYSTGSKQGNKVFRTDKKGSMKLTLHADGGWNLSTER